MNVDTLLMHLSNTSHFLRQAGATKPANDLHEACELFRRYQGQKLDAMFKDIDKARAVVAGAGSRGKKLSAEEVATLGDAIVHLHNRAGQPGLTGDEIDAAFADPRLQSLTEPQLKAISSRFPLPNIRGKQKIIDTMKKAVRDRIGAIER